MDQRVFLTGASGFIGRNLIKKLLFYNNQVIALVRKPIEDFGDRVRIVEGDILKPETFISVIKECEVVFHCAAYITFTKKYYKEAYQINVEGTKNILEAAYQAGIKKVTHLSACAVLGFSTNKNGLIDETANPTIEKNNIYAHTKKLAEEEVQKYVKKGLNVSIANIATVYGPEDRKLNSGAIIKSILKGKLKLLPPGGTSFVSVDDLVNGLILLMEKGGPGERYIFCAENMEYRDLARRIANILKLKNIRLTLPNFTYYPALWSFKCIELFSGLINSKINLMTSQILKEAYGYKYFSSEKAKKELGWKPTQSFEEAVERAFDYYKENHLI